MMERKAFRAWGKDQRILITMLAAAGAGLLAHGMAR